MCDLSCAEQGSLTSLLGDLQAADRVRVWVTAKHTAPA
jgi:hypothetical protein